MRLEKTLNDNSTEEERSEVLEFGEWLLEVGEGRVPPVLPGTNIIKLDDSLMCDSPQQVFDTIYANIEHNVNNSDYFKERAILCATNETVDKANEELLQKLSTPSAHCHSIDTVLDPDQAAAFQTEFLNSIEYSGLPQHHLHLKKGAVILLMRNLDVKNSHCNGSRYIIEDITRRLIIARRLDSNDDNDTILIPRIPSHTKDTELPFIMKRLQFPVKLAFVMTFNRAQGQSMKHCGILLPTSLWAHGQLYVGASRCSNKRNLKIWADQTEFLNMNLPPGYYTRNVVYTELFSDE